MATVKSCKKSRFNVRLTPAQYDHVYNITTSWGIGVSDYFKMIIERDRQVLRKRTIRQLQRQKKQSQRGVTP